MNLTKLHIKESLNKASFIIFAIIGLLITFLAKGIEITAPGVNTSGEFGNYGVQWVVLSFISSLSAVTLSTGSFNKYLSTDLPDVLRVHGLSLNKQLSYIFRADIFISMLMGILFLIGMLINIIIERPCISILGFLIAIIVYLITILIINIIMGIFNLVLPSSIAALLGVFFVVIGVSKGIFNFILEVQGGIFADIMIKVLNIFPPINDFGKIARDLFLGEFNNIKLLAQSLLYLWIIIGLYYLLKKWKFGNEN